MQSTSNRSILFVDDEVNILNALRRLLFEEDYTIFTATSAEEGLAILEKHPVQVVISDQRMPGTSGTEFLRKVMEKYPAIVRVILSGYADVNAILDPIGKGELYRFLAKPWNDEEMKLNIRQSFSYYDILQVNNNLMAKIEEQNQEMVQLKDSLERVIEKQAEVLSCSREILDKLPIPIPGFN